MSTVVRWSNILWYLLHYISYYSYYDFPKGDATIKGQIKNYIFERKIHSFQILFQWHLLVLRRKVSPEDEAPSVWKIESFCLENIFLLRTVFDSFGVAIFFTPLEDCSHCFGSQTVIVSCSFYLFSCVRFGTDHAENWW